MFTTLGNLDISWKKLTVIFLQLLIQVIYSKQTLNDSVSSLNIHVFLSPTCSVISY